MIKTIKICALLVIMFVCQIECLNQKGVSTKMNIKDAPYVILLILTLDREELKCSGVLIAEDWVITAAHCISVVQPENIKVIAGIDDLGSCDKMQIRFPLQVIYHPQGSIKYPLKWDIALLQVDKFHIADGSVAVAELGTETWPQSSDLMYKRKCKVIGWGLTNPNVTNNTQLHSADVLAEHGSKACKCLQLFMKRRAVCLDSESGTAICPGDSGGPIVCDKKSYAIAHLTYDLTSCTYLEGPGMMACKSTNIAVYTYICPLLDWINQYVSTVPKTPLSCSAPRICFITSLLFIICILIFRAFL